MNVEELEKGGGGGGGDIEDEEEEKLSDVGWLVAADAGPEGGAAAGIKDTGEEKDEAERNTLVAVAGSGRGVPSGEVDDIAGGEIIGVRDAVAVSDGEMEIPAASGGELEKVGGGGGDVEDEEEEKLSDVGWLTRPQGQ